MSSIEPRSLVAISEASRMLAEAKSLEDVRTIRDLAEAARVYARAHQLGIEAENHAAEIKLRAERKGGELLITSAETGDRVMGRPEKLSDAPTLSELGIRRDQSSTWQAVAQIPEDTFEAVIADAHESGERLTTTGVLRAHVANNSGESEWYTPEVYTSAARAVMGSIDLDPASNETANTLVEAAVFYTEDNDGLQYGWRGNVWMNPPYKQPACKQFVLKLADEYIHGNVTQACVLVNNATETDWFQTLASNASAICFPNGRIRFWHPERGPGAPLQGQAVLYLGPNVDTFRSAFRDFGFTVTL